MADAFQWTSATPESVRMSSERLRAMREGLAERGTKELLVVREDRIVEEWYAPDFGPQKHHYSASLAKALVGGLSLMLALDDGLLGVDDLACDYVPQWRGDPQKSRITVRHLATHSSGLEDAELSAEERTAGLTAHHMSLPGWKGAFWRREPDPFTIARDPAPVVFEPGSAYAYSNTGMAMLGYVVTAALRDRRSRTSAACSASASCGPSASRTRSGPSATGRPTRWTACRSWPTGAEGSSPPGRRPGWAA